MAETVSETNQGELIFLVTSSILAVSGFVGNTFILLTLKNEQFKRMSTSVYLAVLAVADNTTVFVGVVTYDILTSGLWVHFDIRSLSVASCIVFEYLFYLAAQVSAWCIVFVTLERLVALLKPHR